MSLLSKSLIFLCFLLTNFEAMARHNLSSNDAIGNLGKSGYTMKLFKLDEGRWGYALLKGKKEIIHQEEIPSINGKKYFTNKKAARKTGRFVLKKLKKGIFPPTISVEDLKKLKVIK